MNRKISIILVSLAILALSACVAKTYVRNGSKISLNKNTPKYPGAFIDYESELHLLAGKKKEAEVQMWDSARIASESSKVPRGGYVILTTAALTLEAAKTDNFEVMVVDSAGETILREKGKNRHVPSYSINSSTHTTTWSAIEIFYINKPMDKPFKVFVFNTLTNARGEFDVYPNQTKK
jgi:hypothetical protein